MKLVMTFAMLLATSALFAQQKVNTQLRSQAMHQPANKLALAPNKDLRPVQGVVRIVKGVETVSIEVQQGDDVVSYLPVNLPEEMMEDGALIQFKFTKLDSGAISLRDVSAQ